MAADGRRSVCLVQQGVWDLPLESMPLAAGYLKAAAASDDWIRARADIAIHNFRGGDSLTRMAQELLAGGPPDVLAFSVLGWNFRQFGALAETFKQINPHGWVIFGGTHVANQAARTFRLFPDVDVVVNGEGELAFRDLLAAHLAGASRHELDPIAGISYRLPSGEIRTTPPRERLPDLDLLPSPVLTGAIELTDRYGQFRYDVALMETNRGCPYKCSFCYWGGAVGQRVRSFSRDRLRAELEVFARHQVHTLVLCDANFGILPTDREFVEDVIEVRDRYGYPQALDTSWAKNKSTVFFDIVRRMTQAGLRSSFTLALQSLSDAALRTMNRRNMKINQWEDLVRKLDREGLDCYTELIWGVPGETVESFLDGYDRLSRHVSRIAVYPLLLLPNTEYAEKKQEYGIVSVRGDRDDFEYILAQDSISLAENRSMMQFLFWARVLAENALLRNVWVGLRELTELSQSQVLRRLDQWVEQTDDPAAKPLQAAVGRAASSDQEYGSAVGYLCGDLAARRLLSQWWSESVRPLLPPAHRPLLDEIFRFDLITQPHYHHPDATDRPDELPVVELPTGAHFVRKGVALDYDVPAIVAALRRGERPELCPEPVILDLYYRVGADSFVRTTNHEQIVYYVGMTGDQVLAGGGSGGRAG